MMRKVLLSLIIIFIGLSLGARPSMAQATTNTAVSSAMLRIEDYQPDGRAETLALFFQKQNSPLTPYADEFVAAADTYEIDWRLVPAITGVESSFGKRIPYCSYNAYGWNNGDFKFGSWEESIWHVSKTLRERYLDRGATSVGAIGRIYAPPSTTWAGKVNHLMAKIEATPKFTLDL